MPREMKDSGDKSSRKYFYDQFWSCENCGEHGIMSVKSTPACPQCYHYRCKNCPVETAKIPSGREGIDPRPIGSTVKEKVKRTFQSRTPGKSKTSSPISVLEEAKAPVAQYSESYHQPITSSSKSVDFGTQNLRSPMSKISDANAHSSISKTNEHNTHITHSPEKIFPSTADESDHLAVEDRQKPKKRQKRTPSCSEARKIFACPFNKFDPCTYDPRVLKKYRTCLVPSALVLELRRMKDHLLQVHGPLYCDRCSEVFDRDSERLLNHSRESKACMESTGPPLRLETGIPSSQWFDIYNSLKEKGGLKGIVKERHEIRGWNRIWGVLFPNTPQPSSPWVEPPSLTIRPFGDVESSVAIFKQITAQKVKQKLLMQDDDTARTYEEILRESFQAYLKQSPYNNNHNQVHTTSMPHFSWTDGKIFEEVDTGFPTKYFGISENYQSHQDYPNSTSPNELQSQKHSRQSQSQLDFPEFDLLRTVVGPLPSAFALDSNLKDAQVWLSTSGIDPNVTLLSPSHKHNHPPNISKLAAETSKDYKLLDPSPYSQSQESSVSGSGVDTGEENVVWTPYAGIQGDAPDLDQGHQPDEFMFSQEDHQNAGTALDVVLGITDASKVHFHDLG